MHVKIIFKSQEDGSEGKSRGMKIHEKKLAVNKHS